MTFTAASDSAEACSRYPRYSGSIPAAANRSPNRLWCREFSCPPPNSSNSMATNEALAWPDNREITQACGSPSLRW
ncbi:Uncharacterised protein [Mycobacteroides abscessus subsp. abscessus]|nr:Uncharacterised protein [Mycobacteroides abscessus subsp. abscessus]